MVIVVNIRFTCAGNKWSLSVGLTKDSTNSRRDCDQSLFGTAPFIGDREAILNGDYAAPEGSARRSTAGTSTTLGGDQEVSHQEAYGSVLCLG